MHHTGSQSGHVDHEYRETGRKAVTMHALSRLRPPALRSLLIVAVAALALSVPAAGAAEDGDFDISQLPLTIGGQGVSGNLALVPATTASTINRVANPGPYKPEETYSGYFDSDKCYVYEFDEEDESERHFRPTDLTDCGNENDTWAGNFLNWAATQTVDVFRKAMTGGYRARDDVGVTWLEKAFHTGQTGEAGEELYPDRRIEGDVIAQVTPFAAGTDTTMDIRISGLGNRMRFVIDSGDPVGDLVRLLGEGEDEPQLYEGGDEIDSGQPYDLNVRVSVCESGDEPNCEPYGDHWKPEGALQENADRLRYSVFGYLNLDDDDDPRDASALRARNKWIGPEKFDSETGVASENPEKEWNPDTGVLKKDPNADEHDEEFEGTRSGVINSINLFGQLVAKDPPNEDDGYPGHMPFNPVSELHYTALRYLSGDDEGGASFAGKAPSREILTDRLPVINDWDSGGHDPIGAWCEPNAILGIGDTVTHADTMLSDAGAEVAGAEVRQFTRQVMEMEGIDSTADIAGLAYLGQTTDIRPDKPEGDVTVSTFWLDALRDSDGEVELPDPREIDPPRNNPYYLAAKYGGFTVPSGFDPLAADILEEPWWHTNDDELRATDGDLVPRPDNYYPAGRANDMVGELDNAFDAIVSDLSGSSSAIAANSTRLDTGTLIYQARFNTADWSGELLAIEVDPDDGSIDPSRPLWDAADRIPDHSERRIFSIEPDGRSGILFDDGNNGVTHEQMELLDEDPELAAKRLAYLRGDRSNEIQEGGDFRDRSTLLGDIVNSDPAFVGAQNFGYSVGGPTDGLEDEQTSAFKYQQYRLDKHEFDQPMIYVGSNNGMLHGFDAEKGHEVLAYVPNAVFENLSALTSPRYGHRYYVDGSPRHGDAYIDRGSGEEWRTYLAGTTGAGGRAVFALDIPDPNNETFRIDDVLWEFTHPELGAAMAQPHIVRMNDHGWYVVFGNGYNSESGNAGLFLVPLDDPDNYIFIDTGVGGTGADAKNGLSHTTPVDITGNRTTDYIYGGDMQGNMWRFDVTRDRNDRWSVDVLFEASDGTDPQPITAAPEVGPHPSGEGRMVYFGTGQFFEVGDNQVTADAQTQTFYGVHDTGGSLTRGDLHEQTIVASSENFRVIGDEPVPENKDGWFIDLPTTGERVFQRATLRNERIIFVTNIPTEDVCGFGGDSWIMEMNAVFGTGIEEEVFVDEDAEFGEDTADGMRFNDMVSRPAIIDTAGDTEFKYLSGSSGNVTQVEESSTTDRLGRRSWREF